MDFVMSLIRSLKALADENRLRILRMLLCSDLCVGALANHLGISKPAVSQHLRILRKAELVRGEKRGYWTHYRVDKEALTRVAAELKQLSLAEKHYETICWRINEMPVKTHQAEEVNMCQNSCQKPDKLKDKPENCSPEQIRECHGDTKKHPCLKENSVSENK
ncbi:MAG: winged helix-turn-helix transcriptional regulator [Deltaproteobacteria bacterium]|jgi:DNA-binding transcriptional ArsR family regulator|nr:winged helix-turn-helix transcriptional regulator [Deltaproteobacteria bacterium]MBW2488345.1 winged helix-turn-helix transcriptional regulator [Deltaproteobacteria bacterium]